jgi:hypothetical protein
MHGNNVYLSNGSIQDHVAWPQNSRGFPKYCINEKTVKVKCKQKRLVTAACFKVLGEDFLLENGTARLLLHTFFSFQSEIEFLTAKRKFTPRSKQLRCITPRITVSDINKVSTAKFPARRFNNLQT